MIDPWGCHTRNSTLHKKKAKHSGSMLSRTRLTFHEPAFLEFKTLQEFHGHLRLTVAGEKLLLHFHRADGQPSQRKIETLCLADAQDFAKILCRCHRHERELGARLAPSATYTCRNR